MMKAPGTPMASSQSNVMVNKVSPAVNGVMVVIHFSKYATFPSLPRNSLAKHIKDTKLQPKWHKPEYLFHYCIESTRLEEPT